MKSGIGLNNISKIRLLNCLSNDVRVITYLQLFHYEIDHTIFEVRAFIHDYISDIRVKVSPLDTTGSRLHLVYPYNWLLRLWRQEN